MDKKQFVFSILDERNNKTDYDNGTINPVLARIEYCKKYSKALAQNNKVILDHYDKDKYLFPTDIKLSPEDVNKIIGTIDGLKGNYLHVENIKLEILQYIFEHVSDESKIEYFRSNEFVTFLQSNGMWPEVFSRYANAILETVSEEKHEDIFNRSI